MKRAIYAGSFDPWSFGHQFVLESTLRVFDEVHVLAAINPAKLGDLDPNSRACCIAHSINPYVDWWGSEQPFRPTEKVVVAPIRGLVADYARSNGITTLVRGLRSTSDFEAEFNLYFSNHAIDTALQTWCVMCPPELLHCSSTYVRSVVGRPGVDFVGTNFLTQALLLKSPRALGHILDLILRMSKHRFDRQPADLTARDLSAALQRTFLTLVKATPQKPGMPAGKLEAMLARFLKEEATTNRVHVEQGEYPADAIARLWAILAVALTENTAAAQTQLSQLSLGLGKTDIPLFAMDDCAREVTALS
jgi:pantetheine-phosphate adenylyltransferase